MSTIEAGDRVHCDLWLAHRDEGWEVQCIWDGIGVLEVTLALDSPPHRPGAHPMRHPLLRGWSDYHKPPTLDADPPSALALIGYILLILALVAGWAILTGGM